MNKELIVELGILLNNTLDYYDKLLSSKGLINDFNCVTRDIYYTKEDLDGLTENEMKKKCIRIRNVNSGDTCKIETNQLIELETNKISVEDYPKFEEMLLNNGYRKVFDTSKKDHHYFKDGMNSKIQLQEIDGIGLVLYFDNSLYYDLPLDEQRKKLIDELNMYGFDFKYDTLGIDKLRTLYYKKLMFSKNQNG